MSNILQIERGSAGVIADGDIVVFDTTVFSAGHLAYNILTGVITFYDVGIYLVDWWVATQSSASNTGIVLQYLLLRVIFLSGIHQLRRA